MSRLVPAAASLAVVFALSAWAAEPGTKLQKHADREALKNAIENVLARSPMSESRVGVEVVSLDTGEIIYRHQADELLNPASNVKLFTSAAALFTLGPDFRYETEFYTDAPLQQGKARVLYVRGKGDPTLNTEKLYQIVSELFHDGVRDLGDIVVDDSYFDGDRVPPGYDQEDSDRSYMAPPGAVSLNWNAVGIYLRAGENPGEKPAVELEPPSDYFIVNSTLSTSGRHHRRFSVQSEDAGDRQKIIVSGVMPAGSGTWSAWKKIDNPPMYFGYTLKAMLQQRGVRVRGKVKPGKVSPDARLLYVSQSDTLDLVIKRMNKVSSNFMAEQLLKTMGAEVKGQPGSTANGVEVVEDFLAREVGIPRGTYVMKNGSGLNDTNRFSPAQIATLLAFMQKSFPTMPEYLSSLGIAGMDGTIRYRFEGTDAVGRLRAKTGTLENVCALSGYVVAVGGERFAFSILVNDYPGRASGVIKGLDAVGAAVAAAGSSEGPSRAVAEVMTDQERPGPLDEVKARIRTYLALGKQGDKRNISFLRTAWRSEKDPAVRAVVAESLYQSDRQDYLGARTLLDSFNAQPEVYGRLRKVALELGIDTPGVASVVDLAAEGNLEALSRVVDLSRASQGDADAQRDLAESLSEIARTAPEELLATLRKAPDPDRTATLSLLARGLVATADPDHPFWRALKKSMGAVDTGLATFARQTEALLSRRIAEQKAPPAVATDQSAPQHAASPNDPPVADTRPGG